MRWLERVQAGESFTVTDRGNPIARLVPLTESASDWRREWVEAGRMVAGDRSEAFPRALRPSSPDPVSVLKRTLMAST